MSRLSLMHACGMQLKGVWSVKPSINASSSHSIVSHKPFLQPTTREPLHGRSLRQQSSRIKSAPARRFDRSHVAARYHDHLADKSIKLPVSAPALAMAKRVVGIMAHEERQLQRRAELEIGFWTDNASEVSADLRWIWTNFKPFRSTSCFC